MNSGSSTAREQGVSTRCHRAMSRTACRRLGQGWSRSAMLSSRWRIPRAPQTSCQSVCDHVGRVNESSAVGVRVRMCACANARDRVANGIGRCSRSSCKHHRIRRLLDAHRVGEAMPSVHQSSPSDRTREPWPPLRLLAHSPRLDWVLCCVCQCVCHYLHLVSECVAPGHATKSLDVLADAGANSMLILQWPSQRLPL